MVKMVNEYHQEVMEYVSLSAYDFFELVKKIPYRFDSVRGTIGEVLKRPFLTLNGVFTGGDCDDKAILMASFAVCRNIPYRFKAIGNPDFYHVYAEFLMNDKWIPMDATFTNGVYGVETQPYNKEIIVIGN